MSQRGRVYCDLRGLVVDTSSHGNPGNTAPTSSGYAYHITESGSFGTGSFPIKMAGLKPGTNYYYRACAHNLAGWGYGDEVSFTTKKSGGWNKITSYLEVYDFQVGFPSGISLKLRHKR
jgi:hypothetical protein